MLISPVGFLNFLVYTGEYRKSPCIGPRACRIAASISWVYTRARALFSNRAYTWNRDSSKYWVSVPVHVLVFPAYLGVYLGMGAILKQKCCLPLTGRVHGGWAYAGAFTVFQRGNPEQVLWKWTSESSQ